MADRLLVIAGFGGLMAVLYLFAMRSAPRRGLMRVLETVCAGIVLCYVCGLCLAPFGITVPQSPLGALCAGSLGLPGVALYVFLPLLP